MNSLKIKVSVTEGHTEDNASSGSKWSKHCWAIWRWGLWGFSVLLCRGSMQSTRKNGHTS